VVQTRVNAVVADVVTEGTHAAEHCGAASPETAHAIVESDDNRKNVFCERGDK
jgi:hypothetical protein